MGAAIPIPGELDEGVTACGAKCHKRKVECGQAVSSEAVCDMDKLIDIGPGADDIGEVVDMLPIDMSLPRARLGPAAPFGRRRARGSPRIEGSRSPRTRSPPRLAPLTGLVEELLRPASLDEPEADTEAVEGYNDDLVPVTRTRGGKYFCGRFLPRDPVLSPDVPCGPKLQCASCARFQNFAAAFVITRDHGGLAGYQIANAGHLSVRAVDPGGPAYRAGMRDRHVDWIITHVDGSEVTAETGRAALDATRGPDKIFTIRVKRPDKEWWDRCVGEHLRPLEPDGAEPDAAADGEGVLVPSGPLH